MSRGSLALSLFLVACSNDPSGSSDNEADVLLSEDAGAVDSQDAPDHGDAAYVDSTDTTDTSDAPPTCQLGIIAGPKADAWRFTSTGLAAAGGGLALEFLWLQATKDPIKGPPRVDPDEPSYTPSRVMTGALETPMLASVFLDNLSSGWSRFAEIADPTWCSGLQPTSAGALIGCLQGEHPYGLHVFGLTADGVWELPAGYRPVDPGHFTNNARSGAFAQPNNELWALLFEVDDPTLPGRAPWDSLAIVGRLDPSTGSVVTQRALPDALDLRYSLQSHLASTSTHLAVAAKFSNVPTVDNIKSLITCTIPVDELSSTSWSCLERDDYGELGPTNWSLVGVEGTGFAVVREGPRIDLAPQVIVDHVGPDATTRVTASLGQREAGAGIPSIQPYEVAGGTLVAHTYGKNDEAYSNLWRLSAWGGVHWALENVPISDTNTISMTSSVDARDDGFTVGSQSGFVSRWSPWGHQTCEEAGVCGTMKWSDCDDGNPCTKNLCEPDTGCANPQFEDGTPCGYENGAVRTCAGGVCQL
jgi:hypothetical protein